MHVLTDEMVVKIFKHFFKQGLDGVPRILALMASSRALHQVAPSIVDPTSMSGRYPDKSKFYLECSTYFRNITLVSCVPDPNDPPSPSPLHSHTPVYDS